MAERSLFIGDQSGPVGEIYGLIDGIWLESYGQLNTDIYGLSTATATYAFPADALVYPSMQSSHPIWSFYTWSVAP